MFWTVYGLFFLVTMDMSLPQNLHTFYILSFLPPPPDTPSQNTHYRSVWIRNPPQFFAIFDNGTSTTATNAQLCFGANAVTTTTATRQRKTTNTKKMSLMEAAFALLEWAQRGQPLAELIENYQENDHDDSSEEEEKEDENVMVSPESLEGVEDIIYEDESEEMPDWAQDVVTRTITDLEEDEMETPPGLQVELRPYQKQALDWMTQQEMTINNHWKSDQWQLLKELAQMSGKNKSSSNDQSMVKKHSGKDIIFCDCGPVLVDVHSVNAPPVASIAITYFEKSSSCTDLLSTTTRTITTPSTNHEDIHPLWERNFLCNATKTHAVSFFVQPFFRKATAIPPPAPSPCRGGILADSMGLVRNEASLLLLSRK
jgi:hypothetical protein